MGDWTLFSNHGHVLVCLARDNEARLRSVANAVGITERAVQKIVRELQQAGFIAITKHGRCNRYDINTRKTLRHSLESKCSVGRLLQLFSAMEKPATKDPVGKDSPKTANQVQPRNSNQPAHVQSKEPPAAKQPGGAAKRKKKGSMKEDKAATSKKPADARQQGSLF